MLDCFFLISLTFGYIIFQNIRRDKFSAKKFAKILFAEKTTLPKNFPAELFRFFYFLLIVLLLLRDAIKAKTNQKTALIWFFFVNKNHLDVKLG